MVALRSVMLSAMLTPRVVVFGPGSLDMRLLTAKLAARAGLETSLFVGGATAQSNRAAAWLQPGLSHGSPQGSRATAAWALQCSCGGPSEAPPQACRFHRA